MARFRIEHLDQHHDRNQFDCGSAPLNNYLVTQVGQDTRRRIAACFVAWEISSGQLAGYYTLSAGSVALSDLPAKVAKKLPRYPNIPVIRIGRLAVDLQFQGQQLGAALLFDALKRSCNVEVAAFAAVVDAKNDSAVNFYQRFGFQMLSNSCRTLFLPLNDAIKQLASS